MPRKGEQQAAAWKVGLLVLVAVAVLALGVFLIGEESQLFRRKNAYSIRFDNVSGLNTGNPVQLNGVEVGTVQSVVLPEDPGESELEVWVEVDRRYAERIRGDSQARIKTLGLLGDKYVELTSGSPEFPVIEDGERIPTAPATSVDQLLSSGEDVVDNVTAITFTLRNILERMERGEGLLGELTMESETGRRVTDSMLATLESVQAVAEDFRTGDGALPRLVRDREMADSIEGSLARLEGLLTRLESGDGLLPGMINDPSTKERFDATLANLEQTLENLRGVSEKFAEGDGLLPRLLADEEYGDKVSAELLELLERLNLVSEKATEGDGSVARLLNDPGIYQALNDILIGINESWMLRWLIRSRQKSGIEKRYEDELGEGPAPEPEEAMPPPPPEEPPEDAASGSAPRPYHGTGMPEALDSRFRGNDDILDPRPRGKDSRAREAAPGSS